MIDYDNPKHLKALFFVLIAVAFPLGMYGIYTATNAVLDGYIYVSTRSNSDFIFYAKSPKRYLFFVSFFGFGGLLSFWAGIYLAWHQKYVGKPKNK